MGNYQKRKGACGGTQVLEIVFDLDQTKMILSFKYYVLSNLTLSFSLSHKKIFCVAPSATELNYPFN